MIEPITGASDCRAPSPAEQVDFLNKLQRLLSEGLFTATYKYALLSALADLSIEQGDDSGQAFELSLFAIAEKFFEYYWRQALPYAAADVLRQNTGRPATILRLVARARSKYGPSLPRLKKDRASWIRLVNSSSLHCRSNRSGVF